MKSLFCIVMAFGLYCAARKLNEKYCDELDAAVRAPMKPGEMRDGSYENSTLDDPREVAKTPESRIRQVEIRPYKYAANLCLLGSAGCALVAALSFASRFLPTQQEEPPCDSSES
jgi:hypothetical protein